MIEFLVGNHKRSRKLRTQVLKPDCLALYSGSTTSRGNLQKLSCLNIPICKNKLTLPPCSVVKGDDVHETTWQEAWDRGGAHWVGFIPPFLTEYIGPCFT